LGSFVKKQHKNQQKYADGVRYVLQTKIIKNPTAIIQRSLSCNLSPTGIDLDESNPITVAVLKFCHHQMGYDSWDPTCNAFELGVYLGANTNGNSKNTYVFAKPPKKAVLE